MLCLVLTIVCAWVASATLSMEAEYDVVSVVLHCPFMFESSRKPVDSKGEVIKRGAVHFFSRRKANIGPVESAVL